MNTYDFLELTPVLRLRDSLKESGLFGPGVIVMARAPGRLDVMGGIADYSGSVVCEMPLAVAAACAVQKRTDGRIHCHSAQVQQTFILPATALREPDPLKLRTLMNGQDTWARYSIGCAWWLLHNGGDPTGDQPQPLSELEEGLSIVVDSDVPLGGGVSSSAAIEVATMQALSGLLHVDLSPMELAAACQVVENRVVGAPCGVMDQVTSALGQEGSMLEILCQSDESGLPAQVMGQVEVPPGYAFVGIHSGVRHEVSGDPYTDTRVAAFMGQRMLSLLSEKGDLTQGCLANVDPGLYKSQWRQFLPTAMLGQVFLLQFQQTNDSVAKVDPAKTYHVRSAVTHHVLEHQRVQKFLDALLGAGEMASGFDQEVQSLMVRAGKLMYASHWSYGLRARMGHEMTDKLVRAIGKLGPAHGFYGAKITGGGCGGTVAVLMRDQASTRESVEQVRRHYEQESGRETMLFEGSGPGAAAVGIHALRFEELL